MCWMVRFFSLEFYAKNQKIVHKLRIPRPTWSCANFFFLNFGAWYLFLQLDLSMFHELFEELVFLPRRNDILFIIEYFPFPCQMQACCFAIGGGDAVCILPHFEINLHNRISPLFSRFIPAWFSHFSHRLTAYFIPWALENYAVRIFPATSQFAAFWKIFSPLEVFIFVVDVFNFSQIKTCQVFFLNDRITSALLPHFYAFPPCFSPVFVYRAIPPLSFDSLIVNPAINRTHIFRPGQLNIFL